MTSYLTKTEDGKIFHFRATARDNGVDIVEGQFYNWTNKMFIGCGNEENAKIEFTKRITEKLGEGYKKMPFTETLENSLSVYDKAKWHFQGNFPTGLDDFQGYVHTGMFLGWLIDNSFVSEEFSNNQADEIMRFKNRELTGAQIFETGCDGVLKIEDISEAGNRFAMHYFDFDTGQYLKDYENTLGTNYETLYHVEDSWDNYFKLKGVLDTRLKDWQEKNAKKPFWKFW